jgi:hypothetical protein
MLRKTPPRRARLQAERIQLTTGKSAEPHEQEIDQS